MKILNLSGSAFDIGVGHGKQAKTEIHYSLDSYEKLFWYEAHLDWKRATELAKLHIDYIEKTNVSLLEEIEGIAKGASVDFDDILALNARSEIALTNNKSDGCTSLTILPPVADKAYLGQNWDWRAAQSKSLIITKIGQKIGPTICMVTEGGIIGKIGLNSSGLGVCLNALRANVKSNKLPVHLGLREILNSETLEEAESKVTNRKIASSANFLIVQDKEANLHAANIEVSPIGEDKKVTNDSYLYHTNHFCSDMLIEKIGREKMNTTENTFIRKNRIQQLIKEQLFKNEPINRDQIKNLFADHENCPNSICRHKEEGSSDYTNTVTAFSVIMNLTDRNMYFMRGNPCSPIEEEILQLYRF